MLSSARPAAAPSGVSRARVSGAQVSGAGVSGARAGPAGGKATRDNGAPVNSAPVNSAPVIRAPANIARLVRLLAGIAAAPGAPAKQPFAERLGQWLGWADAISLCALLDGGALTPPGAALGVGVTAGPGASPAAALARLQAETVQAIAGDAVFAAGAPPTDFQAYRRSHAAQQRAMAVRVGGLREQVRATLMQHSASLRQLAALDLLMDRVVGAQERSILSTLPGWLEQRFAQLRERQAGAVAHGPAGELADNAGDWHATFGQEMRALLLAELELRLQPVLGLIEALEQHQSS